MSLSLAGRHRSPSQASSGRSTPVPRVSRRAVEDEMIGADKGLRKYAATIERVLASWEVAPQEWADYIAFLARLLKAIQSHPTGARVVPHSFDVASKLAQCLNPALPSGVHQKALEVYSYIFTTLGQGYLAGHLGEFLPGLTSVLSFASLSVRPALYDIYEEFIVQLPKTDLRPILKSLVLSLLPALEEETSEDFERAFRILESLQRVFSPEGDGKEADSDKDGFFWQCLFLAVITSPSRRQGALNFLSQKLPKFVAPLRSPSTNGHSTSDTRNAQLPPSVQVLLSPEPGLLVRCFAAGLSDPQVLIQRGFLDLLVSHIPLDSPVLQSQVHEDDVDRLITAALHVLLRREMSLNRRLWSWFLGPAPSSEANGMQSRSVAAPKERTHESTVDRQYTYFATYGKAPLERCIQAMFRDVSVAPADAARPFRICLSLMDRWEIGGSIVPHIFLPAMQNAYRFSLKASASDTLEVIRSASLFFDGVESMLIWANLLRLLRSSTSTSDGDGLRTFNWIVQHFNIKDEEMTTTHIPLAALYLLSLMLESGQSREQATSQHAILLALLELIPERVFVHSSSSRIPGHDVRLAPRELRGKIEEFYRTQNQSSADGTVFSPAQISVILPQLSVEYAQNTLDERSDGRISQTLALVVAITAKVSHVSSHAVQRLYQSIAGALKPGSTQDILWAFPDISAIVTLISELHRKGEGHYPKATLAPSLYSHLWEFLSPSRPKYHVEAVKTLWQLHESSWSTDLTEASLTGLVRGGQKKGVATSVDRNEAIRRFTVLWNHTVATVAPISSQTGSLRRRATLPNVSDTKQMSEREAILVTPLMLILDALNDRSDPAYDVVKSWVLDGMSLDRIIQIQFDFVHINHGAAAQPAKADTDLAARITQDRLRHLDYILDHFLGILRVANTQVWQCLGTTIREPTADDPAKSGLAMLASLCVELVTNKTPSSRNLQQKSLDILQTILSVPAATTLRPLKIEAALLDYLTLAISTDQCPIQGPLLNVITLALKLNVSDEDHDETTSNGSRSSLSLKSPLTAEQLRAMGRPPTHGTTRMAPPQLLGCLKLAFSSLSARPHLDQWLRFLLDVLPMFTEAIFANVIPLVECFCRELDKIHADLVSLSRAVPTSQPAAPEAPALIMLEALQQVLALAHRCLEAEGPPDVEVKVAPPPRGVFGNMAAGVFKTESLPSRTPQTNSRLTVILALQDSVRVSVKLWTWCSRYADLDGFDKSSNATTAYHALRIRNRTRHLLEQMFNIEELESLEVVMYTWCFSEPSPDAAGTLDLIHVIPGLRPKNVIPAILDALCSRTNPTALPSFRQSSQTLDLTALDVAWFFRAYVKSIEDDAMDEIWSDCMAFLRDVLANPLPHRQILAALLSVILLLADKIDNTNFGEQRKMRRELGDAFLRLLTATLTTVPSASIESMLDESEALPANSTNSALGRREMSLSSVLKEVTANIEVITETQDRSTSALNNVTTSVIGPLLHAKTFPHNMSSDTLAVLRNVAKKSPNGKLWKKEMADAFSDPRLLSCSPATMERYWFPVFHQWTLNDRERMPELISRLIAPSSAGIMFGVGASAARLEADRKAQLTLRRICVLLLASPQDTFVAQLREMWEKIVELLDASISSSPSAAVKSEVFMLCRTLALTTSSVHLAPFWPVVNHSLQAALSSLITDAPSGQTFGNLALLQACKLLDLLIALSPDDFQLHEWLYISDTVDAVYQPTEWTPSALSDQVAEQLALGTADETTGVVAPTPISSTSSGRRRPLLDSDTDADKGDYKAMGRDDFARLVLRPFLSQLSIHAYEGVYRMEVINLDLWRHNLLQDLLDLHTVVE